MIEQLLCYRIKVFLPCDDVASVGLSSTIYIISEARRARNVLQIKRQSDAASWFFYDKAAFLQMLYILILSTWILNGAATML